MATKTKKGKTVVIDNSKVDNDVEFDIFQEKLNDQMVDAFTGTKSIATLKEKERKVIEFKSRVLELAEIYIHQAQDASQFVEKLIPFMKMISEFNNANKISYIRRITAIIITILQKADITQHLDNIEQCINLIVRYIHKCSDSALNTKFQLMLEIICQSLIKIKSPQSRKLISNAILELMRLMKKNSQIKDNFIRKLLITYQGAIPKGFETLCQLGQINGQFDRSKSVYNNIIFNIIQNDQLRIKFFTNENMITSFKDYSLNIISHIHEQRNKKVGIFRKVFLMLQFIKKAKQDDNQSIIALLNEISESLINFETEDKELRTIVDKYQKE